MLQIRTSSKSIQIKGHNPPHPNIIEKKHGVKILHDSLILRED